MKRLLFAAALIVLVALPALAQKDPNTELGFQPGKLYDFSEVDTVNLFNGNLMLNLPLGPKYPVSSKLSYQFTLVYNGKMWDYETFQCLDLGIQCTEVFPNRRSNAGAGWRVSFGRLLPPFDPSLYLSSDKRNLWVYEGPAGDEHAFVDGTVAVAADSSSMRMIKIDDDHRTVEFPTGELSHFTKDGNDWRLAEMDDRFGNWVKFQYFKDDIIDPHRVTSEKITDSVGRSHTIEYAFNPSMGESVDRGSLITFIKMQGANGIVAPYEFQYANPTIALVGDSRLGLRAKVPVLQTVKQPDGMNFTLDYYTDSIPGENLRMGALAQIHLPTGGSIEYHYQGFLLPTKTMCPGTVTSEDAGIRTRTISDGTPTTKRVWDYIQALSPIVPHQPFPGDPCGAGIPALQPVGPFYWSRTSVLEPKETAADGTTSRVRTDHYFDAYSRAFGMDLGFGCPSPAADGSCPGFTYPGAIGMPTPEAAKKKPWSGLDPFQPADIKGTDDSGRKITTQVFTGCDDSGDCTNGTLRRSTFTLYELHPLSVKHTVYPYGEGELEPSPQLKSSKTVFNDDTGCGGACYVASTSSDDNGTGVYRQVVTESNFPGAKTRTNRTEMVPWTTTSIHDGSKAWITNLYSGTSQEEVSNGKVRQLACFDPADGFLKWQRALADPTKLSKNDVLMVFDKSAEGDAQYLRSYGGDKQNTLDEGTIPNDVCSLSMPGGTPFYKVENHFYTPLQFGGGEYYTGGILAWSRYYDRDHDTPLSFKSVDRTIDRFTGAVLVTRDSAGMSTTYSYDSLPMRLIGVSPSGGATSSYQYVNATPTKNTYVLETINSSEGQIRNTYEFDGLGRVKRVSKSLPSGKYSVVQTDYDAAGRQGRVSQPVEVDAHPFTDTGAYWTQFFYDGFGRELDVRAPDGTETTFEYTGVRQKVRHNSVATSINGDSTATTTELYDEQGRPVEIHEEAGDTSSSKTKGDDVKTTYTYDVTGRITTATTGGQVRTFTYDPRGFLTKESHPENGDTSYGTYDSRGHAWQRTDGERTVDFTFDSAERLRNVSGPSGPLKEFTFGETAGAKDNGKLLTAVRHNERQDAGNVDVTETYSYNSPSGQLSHRTTLVERVTTNQDGSKSRATIQQFDYGVDYDSLLLPKVVHMPTCSYNGCNADSGLSSVTNSRTAGFLTSVDGFADLTYHASGMVDEVRHKTQDTPTDTYSERFGMPRPTKITFTGCTNTKPYFLPGFVRANVDPNACGIQVTWPAATLCGGASNIKYRVLRDGVDITAPNCLTTTSYTDRTAVRGNTYTYSIVAEGPTVLNGNGICQGGETTELAAKPINFQSCDADTQIALKVVSASIGTAARFQATLTTPNGPLPDTDLTFTLLGKVIGVARTATDGVAILDHIVDVEPKTYPGGVSVSYAGGLYPAKTVTADLVASCDAISYGVKPLAYNVLADGGSFPVLVVTSTHCSWTPFPAIFNTFISVAPTGAQSGIGTFNILVPAATGSVNRSSAVQVAHNVVTVQQSSGCTFRFDPNLAYIPYSTPFATSMNVSAPAGCAWTVTTNVPWLHLTRNSGTGDGFISFLVDQNGDKQRTAVLSVNDGAATANVNQYAPPVVVCPRLVTDLTGGGTVSNSQYVSMRVNVEGTYLEYDWYANGRLINRCLVDKCAAMNFAPGNDGYPAVGQTVTYQVVVSNSCDSVVSREVSFTNAGGSCKVPEITDSLFRDFSPGDGISPFPGAEVRLSVVAFSFEPGLPSYQWYHGFAPDKSNLVSDQEGGKTEMITVHPSQTSFYWLEVSSPCGSNISRTGAIFITPPPPRFRRRAVSKDFNGDGLGDLPWHNATTGQNEIWSMSGQGTITSTTPLPNSAPGEQLQSIGDLNGDERPDLVFRDPQTGKNEIWTTRFGTLDTVEPLDTRTDGRWSIGGVADLDNDYNDDVVWHNNVTGENEIWFEAGTSHQGTFALPANNGAGWGLHGADDFNGDGKPDLFFHNKTTGENAVWYMNDAEKSFETGTNSTGGNASAPHHALKATIQPLSTSLSTDWMPALIADMNGDGRPDIVWRNSVTGENKVWMMFGTSVQQTVDLPTRSDPNWQIGGGGSTNAGNSGGGGTDPRTATSITVSADPAPINTATAVTATLKAGTTPLAQKQVAFLLNGNEVSRLLTDATGAATAAVSVNGIASGTYANAITVRFDGDTTYANSSASANLVVLGATPQVAWSDPAAIAYGTPLSAAQLNATANVPGTFVYAPPAGTIVNAGFQTLSVTFTPTDTTIAPITSNAVLFVNKAPSSVSWTAPAAITYGTPLSDLQLNATSALGGTFTYDPAPGTQLPVGTGQTLHVAFKPDSANYDVSTGSTSIDVSKGEQLIRWSDPPPMSFGDPLGAAQLNATVVTSGSNPAGALTYDPPAGTVLTEGVHEVKVTAAATDSYNAATASADVIVMRTAPMITWANPAAIVYGTPLSATQLNATAPVTGTFTYTPAAGTILDSGFEHLQVVFTPADSRYQTSSATVAIEIRKATPVIHWSNPAPIVYGTALSTTQLNATSVTPGEMTYTPKAGTILDAGTNELNVDFLPFDIRNYELVSAKVQLVVNKAPQTITWADPAPIVYGTPLSATQLNATVQVVGPSPAGALTYAPPAGTVLQAGASQALTVTATETPNYNAATASVRIDVLKATPVITWATLAPIIYKTLLGSQQLNATANVPGAFDYTPPAGTLLDAGTHTLTAHFTPSDARNYNDASQTVTLEVQRANPVLTWTRPAGIVYGTALSPVQLNASADVAGSFVYTPAAGTILNAGAGQTLAAHFTPVDTHNYNEGDVSTTIDVAKAPQTITWAGPAPIVYGTPLTSTQLNATVQVVGPAAAGALTYTPAAGTVLDAGSGQTLSVAVAETPNYLPNGATVTIDVRRAPLTLVADAKTKLYGDAVPPLTGTLTGVVNHDPITAAYATTATMQSVTGTYPITASLVDPNHRLVNYDVTIAGSTLTVKPAPLVISAVPASKQYSDLLPVLQAKYTGLVLGETPAVLSGTLLIQTTATRLSPPGTYPITIGGLTSTNYAITYVNAVFTETQEDARIVITSPLVASGSLVTLTATVEDISATPDANGDTDSGDIRNATLTFVDRATNTTLCIAPIGLLVDSGARTGLAVCTFARDFGTDLPASLTIESRIGGYYLRDVDTDDVTLTVTAPTADFITAAGSIVIAPPARPDEPDAGTTPHFELNQNYDSKGILQGRIVLTFTRTVDGVQRQYELSETSAASMSIKRQPGGGLAAIVGIGMLRDLTDKNDPVVIGAGALIVTATDNGEPSTTDSLSFTLYKQGGGIWITTGWGNTRPVESLLDNGTVGVHYGK